MIHRLIQMARDMESVQHVQSLTGLGRDDFQVGLPHVTAHKTQPFDDFRPQCLQAPPQRGLRTTASHPQQTPASGVDLVDHRQEVVRLQAASPMNFVHADGFDPTQSAVRQAPLDKPPWRFGGLYVHVCKVETLREAYRMARSNGGAPGIDGVTFEAIEESGAESFLRQIREELVTNTYRPMRARKKEIPKDGGKKVRVLSIPAIRDRVVQGA
jgi:hypothetical protein